MRLLRLLISKGASCYEKDNEGQTALHLCTRHKSAKCMTLLLRQLSPGEIDDQDKNKVSGNNYKTIWLFSTVNSEIFVRILFSQIELKDIFTMLKMCD